MASVEADFRGYGVRSLRLVGSTFLVVALVGSGVSAAGARPALPEPESYRGVSAVLTQRHVPARPPSDVPARGVTVTDTPAPVTQATTPAAVPHRRPPAYPTVPQLNPLRSDFNGDGWPDLAAAEPLRKVFSRDPTGAVRILYGGRNGLSDAFSQFFTHVTPGMPTDEGSPDPHGEGNDFGFSLASGDFDHDGFADLAIGGVHDRFRLLYGGPAGLSTQRARMFRLADVAPTADVPGEGVTGENLFGWTFATGDFTGDGTDDLVVGAPRAYVGRWIGGVALFRGTPAGLTPQAAQWIPGNAAGLPIAVETDGFGEVLAAADFDRDGRDDLAVGFRRDWLGQALFAGTVVILPGAAGELSVATAQVFHQDTPGVPDEAEIYDQFGNALAAGDITGDGYPDLAVSTLHEGFSENSADRGSSVTVLRGSLAGLTATGAQHWTQRSPGVPGSDDPTALFGNALAFGDFDRDGFGDIAVGSPEEPVGGVEGAGAITIFRGSSEGLTVAGIRRLAWTTPGMPDQVAGKFVYFGSVLLSIRAPDGRASLVVGFRDAWVDGLQRAGAVMVFRGQPGRTRAPGGVTVDGAAIWFTDKTAGGPMDFAMFGYALA
jgi:hypothetical protein